MQAWELEREWGKAKDKLEAIKNWVENYIDPYLEVDDSNITLFRSEGFELKKILEGPSCSEEAKQK